MTTQLFVKMVLDTWFAKVREADAIFDRLTDEQLLKEVASNRNRAIYILGHLTAVHDRMLATLNFGEQVYPHLVDTFITKPDNSQTQTISAGELRQHWKNINSVLADHFNKLQPDEWFQRHNSVSEEDFKKELHRNKLNLIINRTNHLSYHIGQLVLIKN